MYDAADSGPMYRGPSDRALCMQQPKAVDIHYGYTDVPDDALVAVRRETFGDDDIGQTGWTTVDEFSRFIAYLEIDAKAHVLDVACGSGGVATHLSRVTGCRVTGIDRSVAAIAAAATLASGRGIADRARFVAADGGSRLPFDDHAFDAIMCIDAMHHLLDRLAVLREWRRVLRPGGKALFIDLAVITGPVTSAELSRRSVSGEIMFTLKGINERLIEEAGFELVGQEDVTENAMKLAGPWRLARMRHRDALLKIEGPEGFERLQQFFETVETLSTERRLSRIAYVMKSPRR